jgi:hypothetical protein
MLVASLTGRRSTHASIRQKQRRNNERMHGLLHRSQSPLRHGRTAGQAGEEERLRRGRRSHSPPGTAREPLQPIGKASEECTQPDEESCCSESSDGSWSPPSPPGTARAPVWPESFPVTPHQCVLEAMSPEGHNSAGNVLLGDLHSNLSRRHVPAERPRSSCMSTISGHIKPCLPFLFPKGCLEPVSTPPAAVEPETPSMSANFWSIGLDDTPRSKIKCESLTRVGFHSSATDYSPFL